MVFVNSLKSDTLEAFDEASYVRFTFYSFPEQKYQTIGFQKRAVMDKLCYLC